MQGNTDTRLSLKCKSTFIKESRVSICTKLFCQGMQNENN